VTALVVVMSVTALVMVTLEKFAETVGVEYHQLRNYKAVSEAYENAVRTANLSWTHHERIACLVWRVS